MTLLIALTHFMTLKIIVSFMFGLTLFMTPKVHRFISGRMTYSIFTKFKMFFDLFPDRWLTSSIKWQRGVQDVTRKMKRSDSILWKKASIPAEMSNGLSDNRNNATKKFDFTEVADRLGTVSWQNQGHPTCVVTDNSFIGRQPVLYQSSTRRRPTAKHRRDFLTISVFVMNIYRGDVAERLQYMFD